MDTKLGQQQKNVTFQMKALIYKNGNFLDQAQRDAREDYKKLAEEATKSVLKEAKKWIGGDDASSSYEEEDDSSDEDEEADDDTEEEVIEQEQQSES